MTLTAVEREELLAIALDVAREAGKLVLGGWRKRPLVETKDVATDLVTEFDRASEALLRDRLHARTAFRVVGEEDGADRASLSEGRDARALWYVDPIDGTTNFVHGHPFYCVSVGLLVDDQPVLGAVVAPSLHTEWAGVVGGGATRDAAPCQVSAVSRFTDALLATGFPYDRDHPDNNFDAFVQIKRRCQAVRRCGSAALDLCLVADGTYDGYWERRLRPWDLAAGAAIVLAAGGRLSGFGGATLHVGAGDIVASNGAIHQSLIDELAGVPSAAR